MLGMVKANLQLNMLMIGVNLPDIVLIYGIVKNFSIYLYYSNYKFFYVIFIIQTINIVDMKFNSIVNS